MLKKCFYKWVEFHIRKITNRQQWVNATIFRYRQLLKKSFKAIQYYKKKDYEMIMKQKVFNAFKQILEQNAIMIEEIQNIQLRRYFQKFKFIASEKQRNREVTDAIIDCYNNKLLMKWFIKLKKAVKILKKRKNIEKQIENKRKQLFFDKWSLKLQDIKLYNQLLQDSQIYYNEILVKKAFRGWKQMLKNKKTYEKQLVVLSNFFKNWRKYTKEQNSKRNQKYQPIHNKWRKLVFFAYWKNATLDSQKEKLAKDYYLYKRFKSWRNYIDNIQQIQLKLQDKELALTLKQMKRIKLRYLQHWINRYNFIIDKKGLNKVLLETKLKQRRLQQIQFGFKSLKNNVKLNKFQRNKQLVLKQKILYSFKYFTDIRKIKINRLAQFQEAKKLKNQKCIFDTLKQPYLALKIKEDKAKMYYNQRLIKDYFHLFISGIIKQYQKQLKLSAQFYYKRKLIYIFSALKEHSLQQIKRRINKKKLEKYVGQKQYKLMKLIFKKMRGILISELKGRKKLLQLEYNVFYQWRLITRLSVIKRK